MKEAGPGSVCPQGTPWSRGSRHPAHKQSTSLLPLLLVGLMGLHLWLIRHLGIHADYEEPEVFRTHAIRLAGVSLLAFALVGLLAVVAPEDLGYPPVAGVEVTKPNWRHSSQELSGETGAVHFHFQIAFRIRGPVASPPSPAEQPLLASRSRSARQDPFLTACAPRSSLFSRHGPEGTPKADRALVGSQEAHTRAREQECLRIPFATDTMPPTSTGIGS